MKTVCSAEELDTHHPAVGLFRANAVRVVGNDGGALSYKQTRGGTEPQNRTLTPTLTQMILLLFLDLGLF